MPAPRPSVFRFCASCCVTLVCWALWLTLGTTLVVLAYIACVRELPVPNFALRRVEARLAEAGYALQFGAAHLDPTGRVLLENVSFRSTRFDDPLLTCRLLYVRHNFWSFLAGRTEPSEIRVENAAIQLPAMLSPSGTTMPVVKDLAATLRFDHNAWEIDQFVGRVGALVLSIHGQAPATSRGGTGMGPSRTVEDLLNEFLLQARRAMPVLRHLDAFAQPSLGIQLAPNRADLLFTAKSVDRPWGQPIATGEIAAAASIALDRLGTQPLRLHLATDHLDYGGEVAADVVRAVIVADLPAGAKTPHPLEILLAAGQVTTQGETAVAPLLQLDVATWPAVKSRILTQLDGEFIAAEVEAELREQTARIHAEGRMPHGLVSRVLTKHTPRAAPYFVFGDPIDFIADATLKPGWRFDTLATRVDAQRLDSRGVKVTSARGRIDIAGTSFLAHDARVTIGDSGARGSYWMDFATTDYRMLLDGRLRPADINGWFRGDWWLGFWNRFFEFPEAPPAADVDVQGRWREPYLSNNFVRARAGRARVLGGDFEQVNATVFVRPGFAHGWALEGRRAGGTERLSGGFKRFAGTTPRENARFEFDFAGNADPAVIGRMLEGKADEILASLHFTRPPELHAWGALDGANADYAFTGEAAQPLHYFGFPLDAVKVGGSVKGQDIVLDAVDFVAAGGKGNGRAALTGPTGDRRLGFDLFVNGAKLSAAIHAYEEFSAARAGKPYVATPDGKFVRKAANSQLDIAFSAQGALGDIKSFRGKGNTALTGAELGEVHLFGLLSQALSGLSLNFSSLKLDAVRASFDVHDGTIFFPDLKVTGPSAVIDARGQYNFSANALDFNAKFKPYETPGSLLAAAMSLVLNPLTSILELKLSGPLADPKWSVSVTAPSSAPKTPPAPKPLEPTTPPP